MLRICNCSLEMFRENIKGKKLFLWGCGARAEVCYKEWNIRESIFKVVDTNEKMWDRPWSVDNSILCINKKKMVSEICKYGISNCVLMITPVFYSMDIVEELDEVVELNELETYVASLISEYYIPQKFEFTEGNQRIPKKIHYFWFGGTEIPERLKGYIKTWKQFCPDYDIIRWDESNYDITKNQYMYEAYRAGKYGFVTDYARLDVIYNYGGIYLDTDIELYKNLDTLLCDDSFFSVEFEGSVNTGSGFGAVQYNPIIKDMIKAYENIHFIGENGKLNMRPCHHYQNPILKRYGFEITQKYQKINGNVLYPCEVLAPIATYSGAERITEKTHSIHHVELSWVSENDRRARKRFRDKIRVRLRKSK